MGKPEIDLLTTVVTVVKADGRHIPDLPASIRTGCYPVEILVGYSPSAIHPFKLERGDIVVWTEPDRASVTYIIGQWVTPERTADGQHFYRADGIRRDDR